VSASDHPGRPVRGLRADDRALWETIIRSITPLKRRRPQARPLPSAGEDDAAPAKSVAGKAAASSKAAAKQQPVAARPARPVAHAPPPLAPIGRRAKQKLARGAQTIDARIDLHGLTQGEAHLALTRFLRHAQAGGARFVLVITGKGARGDLASERGVLKRQVPMWLNLPELRDYVVGFEAAHGGHGGEGALYVQVRRPR
jgi:DNA-nicking Smr family endonuclease